MKKPNLLFGEHFFFVEPYSQDESRFCYMPPKSNHPVFIFWCQASESENLINSLKKVLDDWCHVEMPYQEFGDLRHAWQRKVVTGNGKFYVATQTLNAHASVIQFNSQDAYVCQVDVFTREFCEIFSKFNLISKPVKLVKVG
jgi:hypothetical protein